MRFTGRDLTSSPARRLTRALALLLGTTAFGTVGLYTIGHGAWRVVDCLYMTVMTLTTVGFGEVLPGFADMPHARPFAVVLMIGGVSAVAYSATLVASVLIEGELFRALGIRRMTKRIDMLSDHYIVCGAGSTGFHVVEELAARGDPVCVVEQDEGRIERLGEHFPDVPWVKADATEDDGLVQAGIARARGVFAALSHDKDNLFLVMSARQANPKARIVARAIDLKSIRKLRTAGADAVVTPNYLGGRRMASEMVRPHVVAFMDVVLQDRDREMDIEEVVIPPDAACAGKTLAEARIRQNADVTVLALGDGKAYRFNPPASAMLEPGGRMMVLGSSEAVEKLRRLLERNT